MGNGDFRPPGAQKPLNRSSWNLAQLITLGTRPHKQKLVYAGLRVYGGRRGENVTSVVFFLMIRRPPRSTQSRSSAASDVYKRQLLHLYWVPCGAWLDAQCTPKRVSVVIRFLACDFVLRVNHSPFIPQKPLFSGHLKLNPMESAFANFLTTDKAIITKLDQNIKLMKWYINHLILGSKGAWPTSRDLL